MIKWVRDIVRHEYLSGDEPIAFEAGCEDCVCEAWERMTDGGITARYGKANDYPVIIATIAGRVKWIPLAAR